MGDGGTAIGGNELGFVSVVVPDEGVGPQEIVTAGGRCGGAVVDVDSGTWTQLVVGEEIRLRNDHRPDAPA